MQTTDGNGLPSAAWVPPCLVAAAMLLLATTALAGPDSSRSTISLEIRAWSLAEPRPGDFVRGSDTAPVTVVSFTDFHCPDCEWIQPTLHALFVRYGDRIRFVHRDFPASLAPQATQIHEAARCAAEQNGFWPYHDNILAGPANPDIEQLMVYAREAGLDDDILVQCLEGGRHTKSVQHDVEEGIRLGVRNSPTFFINGRILRGMHPLESFTDRIDAELVRYTNTSLTSHPAEALSATP